MSAGAYNICIYQGATLSLTFVWSAGACCGCGTVGATPTLVDLTGYTAAMQFRPFIGSPILLYDLVAQGDVTLGGTAGTISVVIPASTTEGFTWYNAVYDLLLTDSSGNTTPLLAGQVTVTSGVSG